MAPFNKYRWRRLSAVAAMTAATVGVVAFDATGDVTLPGFRKADPVDPFASRPGLTPPGANVPGLPTEPRAVERPAAREATYVAERDTSVAPRRDYAALDQQPSQPSDYHPNTAPPNTPPNAPPNTSAYPPSNRTVETNRLPPLVPPTRSVPGGPLENPDPLDVAQTIARVGPEAILLGDVVGPVNQQLALRYREGTLRPQDVETERIKLVQQAITSIVDQKLVLIVARRELPPEAFPKIEKTVNEQFDKTQLKDLMTQTKAKSRAELEDMLVKSGSSLARQRKLFLERSLTQEWIRREVNYEPEVTYDDMLKYYHEHRADYTSPPQVKWEELMVSFDKFPSKREAYVALANMGNLVWDRQASFADVARTQSHGATAAQGGARDWTKPGVHACAELDQAIFSMPIGEMSKIIEGPTGFHIVRVVERKNEEVKPFTEAQVDIREKIRRAKIDKQLKAYLAKLRANTPVWTIFDGPPPETAELNRSNNPPPR